MARLTRARGRLVGAPPRLRAAPKKVAPFYNSAEWSRLSAEIRAERRSKCEAKGCGHVGYVIADHIKEIRDGGAELDKANVQLLCARCHGRKTEEAKRARLRKRRGPGGGQKSTT